VFCQKYFRVLWKTIRKTIRGLYAYLPGNGKVKKIKRNNYDGILSRTIPFQQFRMGNFPNKLYYYHSLITHEPYYIPEKGLKGLSNSPEHAQRVFSFVLLKATVSIFDKLKQLGIYDNSLIFVVADHGGREPETSVGIMVGNSPLDLSYTGFSKYPAGAYNPLLMVKKPFAKGPLKTLKNPAMLSDIRSVISAYVKGSTLDFETLFNLSNIQKRDIKLMIRVNPKARRPLDPYIVKEFSGSLQDIPGHLAN
jgi:hypothetical protein